MWSAKLDLLAELGRADTVTDRFPSWFFRSEKLGLFYIC